MVQPDLNVKFVVEIEPIGFYNSPGRRAARSFARKYRAHIDRALRTVMLVGDYSKVVKVYMVDADTGERIS